MNINTTKTLQLIILNLALSVSVQAFSGKKTMWNENVVTNFKQVNAEFKNIWNGFVEEEKENSGDDFDIADIYPEKSAEVVFKKPEENCENALANIEKSSQLDLPKEYKHFLCTNGTIQIYDPHGNNSFELWSPSKIIAKSQSSLSSFIKRFEEPSYNGLKEFQEQIPLLKKGVVFASSKLRGSDEYDVYFFASSKSNGIAKIYAVEVKDGVWTDQYKSIRDFFTGVISEIDMDELTTG